MSYGGMRNSASRAIEYLSQLLISVDVNFDPLKLVCIGFTPKLFRLSLPNINTNSAHNPYTDSNKYIKSL